MEVFPPINRVKTLAYKYRILYAKEHHAFTPYRLERVAVD
ncbi:hypothetical protein Bhyg_16026 [Pseudolycoriella hygida]|uniref:Uncharacterized protein n=1 Tax=Pseudolycoriella hygida TaxID=35572 RepID=A0A9Q0MNU6_9DIPT|nr:hypothetical protein Bhyg_16026 [Pseudolycoriella hygida]